MVHGYQIQALDSLGDLLVQGPYQVHILTARNALVDHGGVKKTITYHPFSQIQRWLDNLFNMLSPVRRK